MWFQGLWERLLYANKGAFERQTTVGGTPPQTHISQWEQMTFAKRKR